MMTISEIKTKAQALKQAFSEVQSNKELWEKATKLTIESTLNSINTDAQLGWVVEGPNPESVGLYIKQGPEEIAKLIFQINYEGKVVVYAIYSSSRIFPPSVKTDFRDFDTVEISKVKPDVVYGYVGRFIELVQEEYFTKPTLTIKEIGNFFS